MDLVDEARKWLGVPFRHQGRRKDGVDCLGLLVCAADGAGLRVEDGKGGLVPVSAFDRRDYGHVPDADALRATLARLMEEVSLELIEAGDVLLMQFDGNPQHLAIMTAHEGGLGIIHAYAPARKVVEHAFDERWRKAVYACFRVKN